MANEEQLERLKRSIGEWNQWRLEHPRIKPALRGADLSGANLRRADLSGANLAGASIGRTLFGNVDLSVVKGLETMRHRGPSTIGIDTIIRSQGKIPEIFLRKAGMPDSIIEAIPSLIRSLNPIDFYSCFISYSSKDEDFAKRLYADLQKQGVRCWFAPHDLRPGTPWVRGIEEAIHLHEKFLLILSHHAVNSTWVQQEVESALYKEVTADQEILFPIRLDNTVLESGTLWARRLRQRHIGDFTDWRDDAAYQGAFSTLLQHLRVSKKPPVR